MKYCFSLLLLLASLGLRAQTDGPNTFPGGYFDPLRDPLAIRSDTILQLLISEPILTKSLKTRLGEGCQVLKIYQKRLPKGKESLVFEGTLEAKAQQRFLLSIPLLPDEKERFFYASAQGIICSAPGCNNCSIDHGNCVGCCSDTAQGANLLPAPLSKVTMELKR